MREACGVDKSRAQQQVHALEQAVLQHWAAGTLRPDEHLGPRAHLRSHFLAKASKCYRAASLAQHPRARDGFEKTARQWEAMARKAEADDAAEAATAEARRTIGL